ncbi:MAG: hypothetical protein ACJ8AW_41365 [Rhodopila sp.]
MSTTSACLIGFVTGLTAEARIATRCGGLVRAGGGFPAGAGAAARQLVAEGAQALVSLGLAGGLDPALRPGDLVVPAEIVENGAVFAADPTLAARFGGFTQHRLLAGDVVVPDAASKRAARAIGVDAVDLESGAVARVAQQHGLPFAVVRAICDPAERDLPPAAKVALDRKGAIALMRVLGSLALHPGQFRTLIALGADVARARKTLLAVVDRFSRAP